MFSFHFFTFLFLLLRFVTITSADSADSPYIHPFAGNKNYKALIESLDGGPEGRVVAVNVFTVGDGYTEKDDKGSPKPDGTSTLNHLWVSRSTKHLVIFKAMNGLDKTVPRLKMREIMVEAWRIAGLKPSQIKEIKGHDIENDNMNEAIAQVRTILKLDPTEGFRLKVGDTSSNADLKQCWHLLGNTIFGASIAGAVKGFGASKQIVEMRVESYIAGKSNHLYYTFN